MNSRFGDRFNEAGYNKRLTSNTRNITLRLFSKRLWHRKNDYILFVYSTIIWTLEELKPFCVIFYGNFCVKFTAPMDVISVDATHLRSCTEQLPNWDHRARHSQGEIRQNWLESSVCTWWPSNNAASGFIVKSLCDKRGTRVCAFFVVVADHRVEVSHVSHTSN